MTDFGNIGDITVGVGIVPNLSQITAELQRTEQLLQATFKPIPVTFQFTPPSAMLAKFDTELRAVTSGVQLQTREVAALVAQHQALGAVLQTSGLAGPAGNSKSRSSAINTEAQAAKMLTQEVSVLRNYWQAERATEAETVAGMQKYNSAAAQQLTAIEGQISALKAKGVLSTVETKQLAELIALQNSYGIALKSTASTMNTVAGVITRGSLAAGVQAGTAGLNSYKTSLTGITNQTELLANQERAGIITTKELNLALKEQAASLRTGLAAVDSEVMALRNMGVLSLQETERLAQLTQSQNGYTAALARTIDAQQRSNAVGARAGFARGAGVGGSLSSIGMAASLVSPEAGMLGMAASLPPVAAAAVGVGLAVAGIAHATKAGQDEVKKLQQAFLSLEVNGVKNLKGVDDSINQMQRDGSTSDKMFSKSELVAGLALVSRSGFKGAEGMAALQASTRLAASEEVPLNEAVKNMASNLQHLELAGTDAASFGDKLVRASHLTQDSANDFSKGMNVIGFTAKTMGFTVDETMGYLVALSKKGLDPATIGSTGLRNAMQKIENPGKAARAVFAELGVALEDSSGHARKGHDVFTDLINVVSSTAPIYNKTTGLLMNANDRARVNFELFGTRSATAFIGVQHGAKEATDQIAKSQGFLAESSDLMASKLAGAQKRLDASTKDLNRTFAEIFTPTLTKVVEGLTASGRWFIELGTHANEAKPYLTGLGVVLTGVTVAVIANSAAMKELMLAQSLGGMANVATVAATALKLKLIPAIDGATAATTAFMALSPVTLFALAAGGLGLYANAVLDNIHKIQDEVAKTSADVEAQQQKLWSRGREGQLEKQRLDLVQADTTGLSAEVLKHRQDDIAKIGAELAAIRAAQKALPAPLATGGAVGGANQLETSLGLAGRRTGTPFGQKYFGNQIHNGEDLFAPVDTPVTAPFAGFVTTRWSKTTGHIIELIDAAGQKLLLGHLNGYADGLENAIKAAGGKLLVKQGQLVGYVGQTGSLAHADLGPGNAHTHVMGYDAQGKLVSPFSLNYQSVNGSSAPPEHDPNFKGAPAGKSFTALKGDLLQLNIAYKAGKMDVDAYHAALSAIISDATALAATQTVNGKSWTATEKLILQATNALNAHKKATGEVDLSWAQWQKNRPAAMALAQRESDYNDHKLSEKDGLKFTSDLKAYRADPTRAAALAYAESQLSGGQKAADAAQKLQDQNKANSIKLNEFLDQKKITDAQTVLQDMKDAQQQEIDGADTAAQKLAIVKRTSAQIYKDEVAVAAAIRDKALKDAQNEDTPALVQAKKDDAVAVFKRAQSVALTAQNKALIAATKAQGAEADADQKKAEADRIARQKEANAITQALRTQDVEKATGHLDALKTLRDNALKDAGDNVAKQLAVQKQYAAGIQAGAEAIAQAQFRIDKAAALSGPAQLKDGALTIAKQKLDAALAAARSTDSVDTATQKQTDAVVKQRDAYSSIADTIRQAIKDGTFEGDVRQKIAKALNDQAREAERLGVKLAPAVVSATDHIHVLLKQADAAYQTAQQMIDLGRVMDSSDDRNTRAAEDAVALADALASVGDEVGAQEALHTALSDVMTEAGKGEVVGNAVSILSTALGKFDDTKIRQLTRTAQAIREMEQAVIDLNAAAVAAGITPGDQSPEQNRPTDQPSSRPGDDQSSYLKAIGLAPDAFAELARTTLPTALMEATSPEQYAGLGVDVLQGLVDGLSGTAGWDKVRDAMQAGLNQAMEVKSLTVQAPVVVGTNTGNLRTDDVAYGPGEDVPASDWQKNLSQLARQDVISGLKDLDEAGLQATADFAAGVQDIELYNAAIGETKNRVDAAKTALENLPATKLQLALNELDRRHAFRDASGVPQVDDLQYANQREQGQTDLENAQYKLSSAKLTGAALETAQLQHEDRLTQIHADGEAARQAITDKYVQDATKDDGAQSRSEKTFLGMSQSVDDLVASYTEGSLTAQEFGQQASDLQPKLEALAKAAERNGDVDLAGIYRSAAAALKELTPEVVKLLATVGKVAEYAGYVQQLAGSLSSLPGDLGANMQGLSNVAGKLVGLATDVGRIIANPADIGAWVGAITTIAGSVADAIGGFAKAKEQVKQLKEDFQSQFQFVNGADFAKTFSRSRGFFADLFGGGPEVVQEIDKVGLVFAKAMDGAFGTGIKDGMKNALMQNDFSLFGQTLKEQVFGGVVDGITEAFKSTVLNATIAPAIKAWADALKTPDKADDVAALAGIKAAVGQAETIGQAYYSQVQPLISGLQSDFGLDSTGKTAGASGASSVIGAGPSAVYGLPTMPELKFPTSVMQSFDAFAATMPVFAAGSQRMLDAGNLIVEALGPQTVGRSGLGSLV